MEAELSLNFLQLLSWKGILFSHASCPNVIINISDVFYLFFECVNLIVWTYNLIIFLYLQIVFLNYLFYFVADLNLEP